MSTHFNNVWKKTTTLKEMMDSFVHGLCNGNLANPWHSAYSKYTCIFVTYFRWLLINIEDTKLFHILQGSMPTELLVTTKSFFNNYAISVSQLSFLVHLDTLVCIRQIIAFISAISWRACFLLANVLAVNSTVLVLTKGLPNASKLVCYTNGLTS